MNREVEMSLRSLIQVGLAFALSGCVAKIPPSNKDILGVDLPAAYSSRLDESAVSTDWVSQLSGDRVLKELIEDVKKNNWDIKG